MTKETLEIMTKETLEILKKIVDDAISNAENDFNRANMQYQKHKSIRNLELYETHGKKFDDYMKVKEFVYLLQLE